MTLGHVRVGAQARLEIIAARLAKERILRILRQPARLGGEFRRQIENRHMRIVAGAKKEGHGQPIGAGGRRDHAMNIGA